MRGHEEKRQDIPCRLVLILCNMLNEVESSKEIYHCMERAGRQQLYAGKIVIKLEQLTHISGKNKGRL